MNYVPVAIDLFSGCGGFSTGLLDAGIKVAAGFDNESRAIEVYNYNHNYRGATGHVADLGLLSGQDLLDRSGVEDVDLIVGGPHCQALSIIGKRRGFDDKSGRLINDFVRLILLKYKIYISICPPISKSTVMIFG
jgi:DNA (cytosine-5)-methyltransferase 1